MAFKNRIRLPITLGKAQFPSERNVFRKANGERKVLSVIISKTLEGVTDELPEDWHQKLAVALNHDIVNIEDTRLITGVAMDGEYQIDWSDFKNYPVAPASFTVAVTPFDASNNNCKTCADISQLQVEDDHIEEEWAEGQTYQYSDILSNDAICCYPATVSLRSFNTFIFSSVVLTPDGNLEVTLNSEVPSGSDIWVATYRVACPDGSYDEANVYVQGVTGSGLECEAPTDLQLDGATDDSLSFSWSGSADLYYYEVYNLEHDRIPFYSNYTTDTNATVPGLLPDTEYIIYVYAVCGMYNNSEPDTITVNTAPADAHLQTDQYTYTAISPITGICTLLTTSVTRTTEAATASILAGQRVQVTMEYTNDAMSTPVTVDYVFEIGSTTANETTGVSFPQFCGEIYGTAINVQVI